MGVIVADPDLQMGGGGEGGGHADSEIRRGLGAGAGLQKNFSGSSGLILV